MNHLFDSKARRVILTMTIDEFDMIQVFKNAALRYIVPMIPDGDLEKAYRELERINAELSVQRSKQ